MSKKNKWKDLLLKAEGESVACLKKLEMLQQEQVLLLKKEELLLRIIDGLGVVSSCMAAYVQVCGSSAAPDCHAASAASVLQTMQQQEQCIAQHLQLLTGEHDPLGARQHHSSIQMMQSMFAPDRVQKVLNMSIDDIVARLCTLAGKSALLVFQDKQASQWLGNKQQQQQQQSTGLTDCLPSQAMTSAATADPVLQACFAAAAAAPGGIPAATVHCASSSSSWVQQTQAAAAAAAAAAVGSSSSTCVPPSQQQQYPAACVGSSSSCTDSCSPDSHPGVEFCSIMMIVMLWDDAKFSQLSNMNFETMQTRLELPGVFWQHVADKLQLSEDQNITFTLLHEMCFKDINVIIQNMGKATLQQQAVADRMQQHCQQQQRVAAGLLASQELLQQQQELQQQAAAAGVPVLQAGPSTSQQSVWQAQQQQQQQEAAAAGLQAKQVQQLQTAQADLVQQQSGMLKHWKMLGLHMGIAAMTTLTPHQFALFIAASFPCTPRMDLLLAAIDERSKQQQQQQDEDADADAAQQGQASGALAAPSAAGAARAAGSGKICGSKHKNSKDSRGSKGSRGSSSLPSTAVAGAAVAAAAVAALLHNG